MLPFPQRFFKALILLFWGLIALWTSYAGAEQLTGSGVILADRLNLREHPTIQSAAIVVLESGTRVKVLNQEGDWLKVGYGKFVGYVRHLPQYIRVLPEEPDLSPGKTRLRRLEEKASHIDKDIEARKEKIHALADEEIAVLDSLNKTEKSLNLLDRKQIRTQTQLSALEKKIQKLESESKELTRQVRALQDYALKRLVALYKVNQMGTVHFLASARSIHEYLYLEEGLGRILSRDESALKELSVIKSELDAVLIDLKKNREEKKTLEQQYRLQSDAMAKEQTKRNNLLKAIRGQKTLQMASIRDLEQTSRQLEDTLKDLRRRVETSRSVPKKTGAFSEMKGLLEMPVGGKIVGQFGTFKTDRLQIDAQRNGIEIKAPTGSPVKAVFSGTIVFSDWFRNYGNLVIIDHGNGFFTVYAHSRELLKESGEGVEAGEVIATVGDTGSRSGPSLYFEVRHHEKPIDPLIWIKER